MSLVSLSIGLFSFDFDPKRNRLDQLENFQLKFSEERQCNANVCDRPMWLMVKRLTIRLWWQCSNNVQWTCHRFIDIQWYIPMCHCIQNLDSKWSISFKFLPLNCYRVHSTMNHGPWWVFIEYSMSTIMKSLEVARWFFGTTNGCTENSLQVNHLILVTGSESANCKRIGIANIPQFECKWSLISDWSSVELTESIQRPISLGVFH